MSLTIERPSTQTSNELPTGALPAIEDQTGAMPNVAGMQEEFPIPSAAAVYRQHDLVQEAAHTVIHDTDGLEEGTVDVVTTPIAVADARVAVQAMYVAAARLRDTYGEEAQQRALDKTRAVVDVSIAESMPTTVEAYDSFDKLRAGEEPPKTFKPIDKGRDELQIFTEIPFSPVGSESLALNEEEHRIVLDGLRIMALKATHELEAVEAMDLLARMTPSHSEKAYYDARLEQVAGIRRDVAQLPEYNAGADRLLQ